MMNMNEKSKLLHANQHRLYDSHVNDQEVTTNEPSEDPSIAFEEETQIEDPQSRIKPSKVLSAKQFETTSILLKAEKNNRENNYTQLSRHETLDDDQEEEQNFSFSTIVSKLIRILDLSVNGQQLVVFWLYIIALVMLTSIERVTFKMVIDNMTPYRLVVELVMVLTLTLAYGLVLLWKNFRKKITWPDLKFLPPLQLLIIAGLDVIQITGLILAASGITPTMTLILLHASTPFFVLGSKYLRTSRKFSQRQHLGNIFITSSVTLSVLLPIMAQFFGHASLSLVFSSLVYITSAGIQGLAMVYKEYTIPSWPTPPLDIHFLSFCSFSIQALLTVLLSPIIYKFQDYISYSYIGFPFDSFYQNILDGISCIFGTEPYIPSHHHPPYDYHFANCQSVNIWLILGYVVSNICILECVDRILKLRQDYLGRVTMVAVLVAFIALGIYDTKVNYGLGLYGSNIGILDILSLVLLLVGMEIYGQSDPQIDSPV